MAHGDFIQSVTPEEADLVLALMDEVLVEVYQSPARVAIATAARQAREVNQAAIKAITAGDTPWLPAATPEMQAILHLMNRTPLSLPPAEDTN